jgi:hypothetical protein
MKFFPVISRVNVVLKTNVSETSCASIIREIMEMMETEPVSEMLVYNTTLTRLIIREDFII